jgi:hypothetical protein
MAGRTTVIERKIRTGAAQVKGFVDFSMKYKLFNTYIIEQEDDQVSWIRIFPEELQIMTGRGVYRDDVLVLLYPLSVDTITNLDGLMDAANLDSLPVWNKTRYLVHIGNANQGYPVQEAIETENGRVLGRDEVLDLVSRIEDVFP